MEGGEGQLRVGGVIQCTQRSACARLGGRIGIVVRVRVRVRVRMGARVRVSTGVEVRVRVRFI